MLKQQTGGWRELGVRCRRQQQVAFRPWIVEANNLQAQFGQLSATGVKALAYTGRQRHPSMPNVPTSAEAGLPGYEVESWFAVFAPTGTPAPIVARLSSEIKTIVESEAYRKKMDEQGAFAAYMDSQTLAKFVDKELATWANVIKTAGIKAD